MGCLHSRQWWTGPRCVIKIGDIYWYTDDDIVKILQFWSKPFQIYQICNTSTSQQMKILHEKVRIPGMSESMATYLIYHTPIKAIYYLNIQKWLNITKLQSKL